LSVVTLQFAESSSGGISSLGINLQGFIFQLITFVIVLLIIWKYVLPKIVATIEARRTTLEESLSQARATEEALAAAEAKAAELMTQARADADEAMAEAKKQAENVIAEAEKTAQERAARIIAEAEEHLDQERQNLHSQLRGELAGLVAAATEKVLHRKLDAKQDSSLIEQSIKELA
jgi:F-type H+-transporting ATPase subunit b